MPKKHLKMLNTNSSYFSLLQISNRRIFQYYEKEYLNQQATYT